MLYVLFTSTGLLFRVLGFGNLSYSKRVYSKIAKNNKKKIMLPTLADYILLIPIVVFYIFKTTCLSFKYTYKTIKFLILNAYTVKTTTYK